MVTRITRWCRYAIALTASILVSLCPLAAAISVTALLVATPALMADDKTIYVDDSAGSGGDGEDWTTAYRVLQDAIADAVVHVSQQGNNAEIRVAAGTYYPDRINDSTTGTGCRSVAFKLYPRVTMKGGYSGSGTTRDPSVYFSYLDGDIGTTSDDTDNSYHVVTADESGIETTNCVLDGFTVRNGNADDSGENNGWGGGIFINAVSPKIYNCTITHNNGKRGGGIMCFDTATAPEIRNCRVMENTALNLGHGLGGGIDGNHSVIAINTEFIDNYADRWGGAFSIEVDNNDYDLEVTILNCKFIANIGERYAGAIYWDSVGADATLKIANSLFNGNKAQNTTLSDGGAMWTGGSSALAIEITNCTFTHNSVAYGFGGAVAFYPLNYPVTIKNCLFYDNYSPYTGVRDIEYSVVVLDVSYSAIQQGVLSGIGNMDLSSQNPLFVDANGANNISGDVDDDVRLTCASPDQLFEGTTFGLAYDTHDIDEDNFDTEEFTPDLDKSHRVVGKCDMGCYELYRASPCTPAQVGDTAPLPCPDGRVNIDDLLLIIMHWGPCQSTAMFCAGDISVDAYNTVNIDDLLLLVQNWSEDCTLNPYDAGSLSSVEDCMEHCSEGHETYSEGWDNCVAKCVDALCAAEIIDCD